MYKRIITFFLILSIVLSLVTASFAATPNTQSDKTNALKDLGILSGISNFDLTKNLTKVEAVVIYLRLLGKDAEAQKCTYKNPFKDVPAWASKYIAYAYAKGYTSGITKTTFGSNNAVPPEQFLIFMLKSLGYSDKADGDFTSKTVLKKAETLKLIPVDKYKTGAKNFSRGNSVDIIYSVLSATKKPDNITSAQYLINSGAINATTAAKYGFVASTPTQTYKMVKVALKKDAKDNWTIYGADAISAIPGAKYALFNWAGNEVKLGDYANVYSKDDYQVMMNPNKDAQIIEYLTANWAPLSQYPKFGQDAKIVVTVYDDKGNMMAAGIAIARDAIAKGYIELALVNVDAATFIAAANASFEQAFGAPIELPSDAIISIEKAKVNWTFVSRKTGKVVSTAKAADFQNPTPYYRYVINKAKYPDLAEKTKFLGESSLPSGMSVSEAVKAACLSWFKNNYDGTFNTNISVTEFATYSNQWTTKASEWNNPRYIIFADANKKLVAFTQLVPSSLKVIDVGTVDQTAYVD